MLASRAPVSLHHRIVAGGQRRRCIIEGKRGSAQRRHFTQALESLWRHNPRPPPTPAAAASHTEARPKWQLPTLENAAFEEYYKMQGIVRDEEWDAFMSVLRTPLPATFRINAWNASNKPDKKTLKAQAASFFKIFARSSKMSSADIWRVSNEYKEDAIKPLVWYPDNLAWHLNFSRKDLRKNQSLERLQSKFRIDGTICFNIVVELDSRKIIVCQIHQITSKILSIFHEFLKHESEVGNITRQEAVSMVPPLFLNVQPDHHILDMCAAPGSKTFQLLEMINESVEPGLLPGALVVANDVNVERCDILVHNTKRICTANLVITNHEAQNFPACSLAKGCSEAFNHTYKAQRLEFDRVLCDVPCCGDGTIRKGHSIWRKWNSGMGNERHCLQVDIAIRGIELLKVGGRMVYSTCSMNPVENEAVVAELLRRSGNRIELLDVSNELPELVRRPGLITWKVQDRGSWFETYEDLPHNRKNVILPSMFPSSTKESRTICGRVEVDIENNDSNFPLHRCIRIVPHDQNSGAFFIAVLRKVAPLNDSQIVDMAKLQHSLVTDRIMQLQKEFDPERRPSENILMHQQLTEVADDAELLESGQVESGDVVTMLQNKSRWKGVDPVLFFEDEVVIESLISFFGIKESFPLRGHLVTRSIQANNTRRIYYISKSVQEILQLNLEVGKQLKIASLGLRIFETHRSKDECSCAYRLSYEGLPLLLPYVSKRLLYASPVDFHRLLQYRTIKFAHFVDTRLGEEAADLTPGCCVVVLHEGHKNEDSNSMDSATIAMVCWRGKGTMNVMLSSPDRKDLLEMMECQFELNGAKVENEKSCHKIDELDQGR